jgi:hypothetical protein
MELSVKTAYPAIPPFSDNYLYLVSRFFRPFVSPWIRVDKYHPMRVLLDGPGIPQTV